MIGKRALSDQTVDFFCGQHGGRNEGINPQLAKHVSLALGQILLIIYPGDGLPGPHLLGQDGRYQVIFFRSSNGQHELRTPYIGLLEDVNRRRVPAQGHHVQVG